MKGKRRKQNGSNVWRDENWVNNEKNAKIKGTDVVLRTIVGMRNAAVSKDVSVL